MSRLYDNRFTNTEGVDCIAMSASALKTIIAPATATDFPDADGTSSVDGVIIDLWDRSLLTAVEAATVPTITSASVIVCQGRKDQFRVVLSTPIAGNYKRKQKVSLGTIATPSHVGRFNITKIEGDDTLVLEPATNDVFNAADLVGEEVWSTTRLTGKTRLGLISMTLGDAVSGATIRAALIYTTDPSSGVDYATRLAANEVLWSRLYPMGSNVTVDFGGFEVNTGNEFSFFPYQAPLAPATGFEPRLMLVLYWESGTPAAFDLNAQITRTTSTLIETSV